MGYEASAYVKISNYSQRFSILFGEIFEFLNVESDTVDEERRLRGKSLSESCKYSEFRKLEERSSEKGGELRAEGEE